MATPNDTLLTRICKGPCGRILPATNEYFNRDKTGKYGLRSQCKACEATYRATHLIERRISRNAYYASHREEICANQAKRRKKNPAYGTTYRATHREERHAYGAVYRATPHGKELNRIRSHNRRGRRKAQGDTITKAEYAAVLKAHTNKKGQIICAWCGNPIKSNWHYDHWIPLDKGGRHEVGNLRVMHGNEGQKCNYSKGAKMPQEFGKLI